MAKKTQKGKPAKKPARPTGGASKPVKSAKKAAKPAKKAAAKKPVKKIAKPAKKVVKPIKKAAKKFAKPAKKVVAKKVAKKPAKPTKKVVKKVVKKAVKPVKKVVAKKVAKKAAKPTKKAVKKVVKKAVKPVKKIVAKKVAKKAAKPTQPAKVQKPVKAAKVIVAKPVAVAVKPVVSKPTPIVKKKVEREMDLDDDGKRKYDDAPMIVEYKTPSIRKPLGPTPKPHINTDTRTRYSDVELKEFKQLILKKLEEAQKDYELLKSTLSHKDDHGTDDTSPTFKLLEDGSDVLSKEETAHLAGRQEKFIQNLQNALIRIENKTYGICRATGKLISKERLRSVPHATLAIEAKLDQHN